MARFILGLTLSLQRDASALETEQPVVKQNNPLLILNEKATDSLLSFSYEYNFKFLYFLFIISGIYIYIFLYLDSSAFRESP